MKKITSFVMIAALSCVCVFAATPTAGTSISNYLVKTSGQTESAEKGAYTDISLTIPAKYEVGFLTTEGNVNSWSQTIQSSNLLDTLTLEIANDYSASGSGKFYLKTTDPNAVKLGIAASALASTITNSTETIDYSLTANDVNVPGRDSTTFTKVATSNAGAARGETWEFNVSVTSEELLSHTATTYTGTIFLSIVSEL